MQLFYGEFGFGVRTTLPIKDGESVGPYWGELTTYDYDKDPIQRNEYVMALMQRNTAGKKCSSTRKKAEARRVL